MCYATPVQPKIGTDKIIQRWFFYALRKWFQRFTPAQPEIFAKISLYTTLAQPDFYYIIRLKQIYKLQTVPQVGKIIHFAKCLEFAAFKAGWNCQDSFSEIKCI